MNFRNFLWCWLLVGLTSGSIISMDSPETVTIPTQNGQIITVDKSILDRSFRKACEDGELEVVKYFLELGADKNSCDEKFGFKGSHFAARKGHLHILEFLNQDDARSLDGFLPIHIAAMENQRNTVEWYIKKGVDINDASKKGFTPLHMAIDGCAKDVIKYLVGSKGISINTPNAIGSYPIQYAVKKGDLETVKLLLDNGANIKVVGLGGSTLLHLAVQSKNEEMVKFLVNTKKIDLEARITASGSTAFMVAAEKKALNIGKFLMHRSANIHAENKVGETAFSIACKVEDLDFAKMLLPFVDVNHLMDKQFNITILHMMARYGNLKAVQFLIENGADHTLKAKSGINTITAMEIAFASDKFEVASYLKRVDVEKQTIKKLLEEELQDKNPKKKKKKKKKKKPALEINDPAPALNLSTDKKDIDNDLAKNNEKGLKKRANSIIEGVVKMITPPASPRSHIVHQESLVQEISSLDTKEKILPSIANDNVSSNINDMHGILEKKESEAFVASESIDFNSINREKGHRRRTSSDIAKSVIKKITPTSSPKKPSPTKELAHESQERLKKSYAQMVMDFDQADPDVEEVVDNRSNVIKIINDKPGFKKTSIFLYPNERNLPSGIFMVDSNSDEQRLIPVPELLDNIGTRLSANSLAKAKYSLHVEEKEKNHKEIFHNFTRSVERQQGHLTHTVITDFRSAPHKKKYWEEQLGTQNVQDYWFELKSNIPARIQPNHKYSLEKAREEGPGGNLEFVMLAQGLGENDNKTIVHRFYKPDKKDKK